METCRTSLDQQRQHPGYINDISVESRIDRVKYGGKIDNYGQLNLTANLEFGFTRAMIAKAIPYAGKKEVFCLADTTK